MAITYRDAGVDIDAGDSLVERIKPLAKATRTAHVLSGIGGFAGLCGLPTGMKEPVLVSGTDGVGTKLKLAFALDKHDTIGQDLVAMCVNDILTTGAKPLFFLDYFATGKLSVDVAEQVVKGIAGGCKLAECALLGGETAELPGMYVDGEYDLAGFAVGVAEKSAILDPKHVRQGDVLLALPSSGLHSNGYSLARRVVQEVMGLALDHTPEGFDRPVGEVMLEPTRIYAPQVAKLLSTLGADLHALSHITGGGIDGNLPRVLPDASEAVLKRSAWKRPAIFDLIAAGGPVEQHERDRTFNQGIGLVAVVAQARADEALAALDEMDEKAFVLGEIAPLAQGEASRVRWVDLP